MAQRDETGATAVEYGLLVALVAAVIIGSVILLGDETTGLFARLCNNATPFSC